MYDCHSAQVTFEISASSLPFVESFIINCCNFSNKLSRGSLVTKQASDPQWRERIKMGREEEGDKEGGGFGHGRRWRETCRDVELGKGGGGENEGFYSTWEKLWKLML